MRTKFQLIIELSAKRRRELSPAGALGVVLLLAIAEIGLEYAGCAEGQGNPRTRSDRILGNRLRSARPPSRGARRGGLMRARSHFPNNGRRQTLGTATRPSRRGMTESAPRARRYRPARLNQQYRIGHRAGPTQAAHHRACVPWRHRVARSHRSGGVRPGGSFVFTDAETIGSASALKLVCRNRIGQFRRGGPSITASGAIPRLGMPACTASISRARGIR